MTRTAWVREGGTDPEAITCAVVVDDRLFRVRNVTGPGWYLHVYDTDGTGDHVGMANWEDWTRVEEIAREAMATLRED